MITRVMGKKTETWWTCEPHKHIESVAQDGSIKYKFDCKPELKCDVVELDPVEVCQYDGNPLKSNVCRPFGILDANRNPKINIGDEEIDVIKETFYADLGEWQQLIDKVVENTDHNKESAGAEYAEAICEYNEQTINEDERMKAYCELHHLDPAETDVDELRKIVYGNTVTVGTILTSPSSSGYTYTIPSGYTYTSPSVYKPTWTVATTDTNTSGWI